jgi:hypothetical protein
MEMEQMAKKATKREGVVRASDRTPRRAAQPPTVTESEIARRAYDLYLARGRKDGHDVEDWLQAEHELNGPVAAI